MLVALASTLVLWAWERPEDLRFAPADAEIAVQTGFVELRGDQLVQRGRRFPLLPGRAPVTTAVVHVQIAPGRPLRWSPALRDRAAQAVLHYGRLAGTRRLQLDFEVRASQRAVLLDLLHAVRAGLPNGVSLSMTALASWCGDERWLSQAPVDEVAPMLFRMGRGGAAIRSRLEAGGDFADAGCRSALAVSTDAPVRRAPAGRRVYLFSPRSWTASDFTRLKGEVERWDAPDG